MFEGMYTWPAASVLAHYINKHKCKTEGLAVLELGAGTALPGLAAATEGRAKLVVLSDIADCPTVLAGCRSAVPAGYRNVDVTGITWGAFSTELENLPSFDLILGADMCVNHFFLLPPIQSPRHYVA